MSTDHISPIGDHHATSRRRRLKDPEYLASAREIAPYEALARMVIRFRMEHDLTQEQLAETVGTSHSAISRVESGMHRPNVETLQKLARAFQRQLVIGFADPFEGNAAMEPLNATIAEHDAELVALP